jgi:hypothetical protein
MQPGCQPLTAAVDAVGALLDTGWDGMPISERLAVLDALEKLRRASIAASHDVIASLAHEDVAHLGGAAHLVIADRLRITPSDARRRIRDAQQLIPRITLIGDTLAPQLPATAVAWHTGTLDGEHLRAIQRFFTQLPATIAEQTRESAEEFLADKAAQLRPDQLGKVADRLAIHLNPDGTFSDTDRARRRGFTFSPQHPDGTSEARLVATPELRAALEAWFAKFAAPAMCDPADQTPRITGEPSTEAAQRDTRSHPQRQHDALLALVRSQLGNPALGQHHGLPVTVMFVRLIHC